MKVLVTGAGGFIGSHMVAFLKEKGYWVRAVDIKFPEFRRELWGQADDLVNFDLRYYGDDFSLGGMLHELTEDVSWIFHFAADMGGVGYFHSDRDLKASQNNAQINLNILEALKPEQKLFFSSSACSYPIAGQQEADGGHLLSEDQWGAAPCDQLYGEEKRTMTLWCNQLPNARVGIFHTIYGPGQEVGNEREKFPPAITRKVLESQGKIEIWGDGSQVRTFLYIDDALEKIWRVMTAEKYEGPVNIGSDEEVTVKECADVLCKHAGITPHYEYDTSKPSGVMARSSDNTKFNRLYGEVPQTPAAVGFASLYDWLKDLEKTKHQPTSLEETG